MESLKMKRTGYKGFNVRSDGVLFCRDMLFEVGKVAKVEGPPKMCENGIHFCWNLNDVNNHYNLADCVICEVEPIGDVVADTDGRKCCTNALKIIRMLTKEEVLRISNSGSDNTGFINTGNGNTGNRNTGNGNTGNRNTGWYNTGDGNTGNRNTGNRNTGWYNTGDGNTGNYNTGWYNTGWYNTGWYNTGWYNTGWYNTGWYNTGDGNTGFFNQEEHECYIFDNLSKMTPSEFRQSKYASALYSEQLVLTEWIHYTPEEMTADKAKELIGGYLKQYEWKDACATWWNKLSDNARETIQQIPGFTKKKFKEITGIDL